MKKTKSKDRSITELLYGQAFRHLRVTRSYVHLVNVYNRTTDQKLKNAISGVIFDTRIFES